MPAALPNRLLLLAFLPLVLLSLQCESSVSRPNVLVVMVDDMGFSDLGCYGGEIETPTLDRLAANGLRFTQFYNTAKCHSSRVSLLTGQYCMQAGDIELSHGVTSAEILSKAGYFTMMTGKWHLKKEPTDFGFQRYFGHLSGACNFYKGDNTFRLNGKPWEVPKQDFYTTVEKVDFAIDFLEEARETKKPWYLYIAFNAPHAPLQPLKADYEKYLGTYKVGWDAIRDARFAKQKALGLFDKETRVSPRPAHVSGWNELDDDWKTFEEMRMTALAGMMDRIDQEMGRLVANLKEAGELEDTLILFVSDNGACPYDRGGERRNLQQKPYDPNVRWSDSTGWAWARNTPFRYYKQNQYEGGITTPAIVHWPAGLKAKAGSITDEQAHIIDVVPTLSKICQAPIPNQWPDRELRPVSGTSLVPIFAGKSLGKRPPIHFLFGDDRALRDESWKLVSYRSEPWNLYHLDKDRTEIVDLATKCPERVERMAKQWHEMTKNVLHASEKYQKSVRKQASGVVHPEYSDFDRAYNAPGPKRKKKKG